ncbi:MAG: DUF4439 domain-containing protein, partial [Actinomycetes bacterium]
MLHPRPGARPGLSRRGFLGGGLAAAAALAGCSVRDPRVDEGPPTPASTRAASIPAPSIPGPPNPAFAGAAEAADREQALADLCAALLRVPSADDLDRTQRRRLASVRDAHDRHAAALRSPDPTVRADGPVPARDPEAAEAMRDRTPARALALLVRRERDLAERHRSAAVAATAVPALVWGSLSVAAGAYARTLAEDGPAVGAAASSVSVPVLSDVAAMQELVRQLHAVVYGYQLALGRLPVRSGRYARGRRGLAGARDLRDRLAAILARRSAAVPVPEAAYVPAVQPRTAATATELIRRMEVALLAFAGLWVAASATVGDRELA